MAQKEEFLDKFRELQSYLAGRLDVKGLDLLGEVLAELKAFLAELIAEKQEREKAS